MSNLPCWCDKCIGRECGNFNDPESRFGRRELPRGCKGGEFPPWSWAKWYEEKFGKETTK